MECGEAFGASASPGSEEDDPDAHAAGEWQEPPPSVWEGVARVLAPARAMLGQLGDVFVNILENPALYGQMPGGSLSFLGLGFIALALLLSMATLTRQLRQWLDLVYTVRF